MSTVVVGGALANKAGSGGEAWVRMSWVRGLASLGHDVWFVEQVDASRPADAAGVGWFRQVVAEFGITARATLLHGDDAVAGPALDELMAVAPSAHLVNISGHVDHPHLFPAFAQRVLVDIDPGFTQFWYAAGERGARVAGHDAHFTIGEAIGTPGCDVPTSGVGWRPTRQPVVLDDWPAQHDGGFAAPGGRFTTVANWRGPYGVVEAGGRTFGLKVHEFRRFWDLPCRVPQRFELALAIDPADGADRAALDERGWALADPVAAAGTTGAFRRYVQRSAAEFSVAQGIYVDTGCGWFSDRTVRYLASGRPALVQDTGFSRHLPTGLGLVAFTTLDDAVAGAADIAARYEEHAVAARRLAADHFAADIVLAHFCAAADI